ncbi:MAG: glutamate--tRNA ligase [Mycoplasmataceae bacterium]|nr:glutamate--tRNA ligase [Mycoplasmataceae bacterium]
MKIRTRYAPSPTGFFHIGGARTALFNYLFAKHHGGEFIVRIEDTDIDRNIQGAIDVQLDGLDWLGITPDESPRKPGKFGPYIQSEGFKSFQELGEKLVKEGKAYYCFCTSEELEAQREKASETGTTPKYNRKCLHLSQEEIQKKLDAGVPYAIRLKMPDNYTFEWDDIIRGKISVPSDALTDPIIVKSNGIPTYNFAVVIDDHRMEITHVLRGEEHISNTPYQIAVMQALGYDTNALKFGHLTIIIDESGKKLSKRNLDLKQFIADYQQMGFIGQAVTNFLALLGWSPADNIEINSLQELIEKFDEKRLSTAPSFFDIKKMEWVNSEYIKKMDDQTFLSTIKPYLTTDLNSLEAPNLAICSFKAQLSYFSQINALLSENFLSYDVNKIPFILESNGISKEEFNTCITTLAQVLEHIDINESNGNEIVNMVKTSSGLKGKTLFMPIRLICIGKEHGPEMSKILPIIGKQTILKHIKDYLK